MSVLERQTKIWMNTHNIYSLYTLARKRPSRKLAFALWVLNEKFLGFKNKGARFKGDGSKDRHIERFLLIHLLEIFAVDTFAEN